MYEGCPEGGPLSARREAKRREKSLQKKANHSNKRIKRKPNLTERGSNSCVNIFKEITAIQKTSSNRSEKTIRIFDNNLTCKETRCFLLPISGKLLLVIKFGKIVYKYLYRRFMARLTSVTCGEMQNKQWRI